MDRRPLALRKVARRQPQIRTDRPLAVTALQVSQAATALTVNLLRATAKRLQAATALRNNRNTAERSLQEAATALRNNRNTELLRVAVTARPALAVTARPVASHPRKISTA